MRGEKDAGDAPSRQEEERQTTDELPGCTEGWHTGDGATKEHVGENKVEVVMGRLGQRETEEPFFSRFYSAW